MTRVCSSKGSGDTSRKRQHSESATDFVETSNSARTSKSAAPLSGGNGRCFVIKLPAGDLTAAGGAGDALPPSPTFKLINWNIDGEIESEIGLPVLELPAFNLMLYVVSVCLGIDPKNTKNRALSVVAEITQEQPDVVFLQVTSFGFGN